MDFIEGTTLEKHLEKTPDGRLFIGEVLTVGLLLCSVLAYLHSRQPPIVFRDLKPANIMLTPAGGITLVDFGIARHFKPGQAKDTMPFGSPGYAAPEQYGKTQTTPRTDIYSLGVILHQLITGDDPSQVPFRFAPLQLGDQPAVAGLETLIMQMVEMDATKRPENIVVVKQELQRIANVWSTQQMRGLPAQGLPYQPLPTGPVSWQATIPPTGIPIAAGGANKGQLILLQQPAPGIGGSSASSSGSSAGYWSTAASQTKWNWMAIASLFLGIISIFMPLFSCSISTALTAYIGWTGLRYFLLVLIITIAPAVVAVVCGHIGRRRAMTVPGWLGSKDIASAGMAIGYIFGSIYVGFLCFILMAFLTFIR
jgi:serine/threonine protein kinase